MRSKIEEIMKLGFVKIDGEEVADKETILELAEKLSQVIDHLNTQPQAEEMSFADANGLRILEDYRKDYEGIEKQDTPEEWRDEIDKILKGIDEQETVSRDGWWETSTGAKFGEEKKKEIKGFIQSLLDEREREGYEKGREDQQQLDGLIFGVTVASTTTLEEGWKLKNPKKLKKQLDKLKDNK